MIQILSDHYFWMWMALYWTFSAAVDSMPDIEPSKGMLPGAIYAWIFKFLHTLAGNAKSAFAGAERAHWMKMVQEKEAGK